MARLSAATEFLRSFDPKANVAGALFKGHVRRLSLRNKEISFSSAAFKSLVEQTSWWFEELLRDVESQPESPAKIIPDYGDRQGVLDAGLELIRSWGLPWLVDGDRLEQHRARLWQATLLAPSADPPREYDRFPPDTLKLPAEALRYPGVRETILIVVNRWEDWQKKEGPVWSSFYKTISSLAVADDSIVRCAIEELDKKVLEKLKLLNGSFFATADSGRLMQYRDFIAYAYMRPEDSFPDDRLDGSNLRRLPVDKEEVSSVRMFSDVDSVCRNAAQGVEVMVWSFKPARTYALLLFEKECLYEITVQMSDRSDKKIYLWMGDSLGEPHTRGIIAAVKVSDVAVNSRAEWGADFAPVFSQCSAGESESK